MRLRQMTRHKAHKGHGPVYRRAVATEKYENEGKISQRVVPGNQGRRPCSTSGN